MSPKMTRALLAVATVAPTGAVAAASAPANPHPDHVRRYEATADLAGRESPRRNDIGRDDFLREGRKYEVKCQTTGQSAYGSKIWDLVRHRSLPGGAGGPGAAGREGPYESYYVPARFIRTGYIGRHPQIRNCDSQDKRSVTTGTRVPG